MGHVEIKEAGHNIDVTKKTSTSTPVPPKKNPLSSLSSPQKLIRKKAKQARNKNESDDEDLEDVRHERAKKPKKSHSTPNNAFKKSRISPVSTDSIISFSVSDPKTLELPQFQEALNILKSIGIVQCDSPTAVKKRLSDQSTISLGEDTTFFNLK